MKLWLNPAIRSLVGHPRFWCTHLLLGDVAADIAGEPLPDVVNVGPPIFQPVRRHNLVPSAAWLAMESKGHTGTGKAGDCADGDRRLVEHEVRLEMLKATSQPY